jgi:3,4-dihydroxy-2-butanone 4-phosphate synthase
MDDQAYQVRSHYVALLLRPVNPIISGYICIALPSDRLEELQIPMMVPDNQERHKTAYTVTVDYKHGESPFSCIFDSSASITRLLSLEDLKRFVSH